MVRLRQCTCNRLTMFVYEDPRPVVQHPLLARAKGKRARCRDMFVYEDLRPVVQNPLTCVALATSGPAVHEPKYHRMALAANLTTALVPKSRSKDSRG